MPDLDSGHIFLTTLAPIRDGTCADGHGSWRQRVRNALMELPTAQQSPATIKSGMTSPFARNMRTHLARMFVLDDVVYNGREGHDAIASTLRSLTGDKDAGNPAIPQHTDFLNCSYLVFCADIDAVIVDGAPLPTTLTAAEQRDVRRSYAMELWRTMGEELSAIYSNCVGFDDIDTAEKFADYLDRCHVETTMPFHDYYIDDPSGAFHRLPLKALAAAVGIPAIVTLLALLWALFTSAPMPVVGGNPIWTVLIGGAVTFGAFVASVRYAIANGEKPLPPGPYDDLRSVLKALYVQQSFADLVIDMQGASPEEIHAAYGRWSAAHRPADVTGPSQPPGIIETPRAARPTEGAA
ncbi:hypothetical protein [Sagittula sp.]|uniref:hypothetical protein n=1 Tax=Sagittula sp. TaxID=2038081 RepID=UPI00351308E7